MKKLVFLLAFGLISPSFSYAESFQLPPSGCPMSHCDAKMSDLANTVLPSTIQKVAVDPTGLGTHGGLGCVSNMRLAACTRYGEPPNIPTLVVYDADGNPIWNDGGILNNTAWTSVPIIGADNTIIATDTDWIFRVDPIAGQILWQSAKPDKGAPISPVLVGEDTSMVFLATVAQQAGEVNELSVWDVATGALLSHQPIVDPVTGVVYETANTPAVRGDRAYVLTNAVSDSTDGRLYAIDVCSKASCGVRGSMKVAWYYEFKGPSGASPDIIGSTLYFDGRPTAKNGSFMAVTDRGAAPRLLWRKIFSNKFYGSGAVDPRGGIWVRNGKEGIAMRLDGNTGDIIQQFSVSNIMKLDPSYIFSSVMTVARTETDGVALIFTTHSMSKPELPFYLTAFDVSTTTESSPIFVHEIEPSASINAGAGPQFGIVENEKGAKRIVFVGSKHSTYFIGEP